MFLKLLRIYFLFKNSLLIIMFLWNFTLLVFLLRIVCPRKYYITARSRNGLYHWFPPSAAPPRAFLSERATFVDWHARLGHPADRIVRHVISNFNLFATSNKKPIICPACQRGKSHQLPFSLSENKSTVPLELVFSDVWGPSPLLSNNSARYYVIFVDHFSKFTWFYPIACKSDVSSIFPKFQAYVERLFDHKIKSIQTDGGGEFQKLSPPLYFSWHSSSDYVPTHSSTKWVCGT
jgi:hypothetical protein